MYMQINKTIDGLMENATVNTSSTKEHIAEINRTVRTIKERTRIIVPTMPFNCLHKLLISNIVYFSVLWINASSLKI